jgi:hypothetical protein
MCTHEGQKRCLTSLCENFRSHNDGDFFQIRPAAHGPGDQHIQVNINQQLIIEDWLAWRIFKEMKSFSKNIQAREGRAGRAGHCGPGRSYRLGGQYKFRNSNLQLLSGY